MMELFSKTLSGLLIIVVIVLLTTWPVMALWNILMPEIFGLTTITFWQALGLSLLCNILFKSTKND